MNQKKIGTFIAECRKRKKMTQLELAEKLGVTDRSVSNWENGVCLPDASLYRLLCDILQISINELFAGEFVCNENYKNVADDNLLILLEHRLYDTTSKEITFDEFHNSLKRISEITLLLQRFEDKQEAITYLVNETGLSEEECTSAYDIYMKMFDYK
ncbi:helix-turn-helix domain-containing protein [Anaerocolumna sedimenticola]|uniref:Helix-turn-helix domain-containing protein n=1 Tax=Anaerocolumna sedimenticola TaxID=2696063 RepID=A0A6P1TPA7_9FIRM|nr:helix-turn-helix transcriptional regulator [Anaerocolumna sedimenticola]QHQ62273.1 helix-turn-helix domain-containing protein [Anaerocolumna sedimenticola]